MRQAIILILLAFILLPQDTVLSQPGSQAATDPDVEAIFSRMSAEERVGQLFLVTFSGTDLGPDTQITELISRYRIGGVILSDANDNFVDEENLPQQIYQLTTGLQSLAADRQQLPPADIPGPPLTPGPYIPLFIGTEHDGSGGLHDPLRSGVTPLASNMAIGATWNPAFAEDTGVIIGAEWSALGINLILGPSAGVVETPHPLTTGDRGTMEFGGDAFWVSRMLAAYVRGIHTGSANRIAVFPKYFPGHGGADRVPSDEVATIQRSRDELAQRDLQPFFAITGGAVDPAEQADGLVTGHLKFRGFERDNPRLDTAPISLDQQNLQVLLSEPELAAWRAQGGLVMSDALGLRGVSRLYDPENVNPIFRYRRIAQNALMAGNDILYMGGFNADSSVDQAAVITDTMNFFVQQYNTDPAFQVRVNDAVRRIIRQKLDLYGGTSFDPEIVLAPSNSLEVLGTRSDVTFAVAQQALTLIASSEADPLSPPSSDDRILIFSDTRMVRQCTTCPEVSLVARDALQQAILRSYGPLTTGEVSLANIRSFSFDELSRYFTQPTSGTSEGTAEPDEIGIALNSADWVIFVMLDVAPSVPSSYVVEQFLASPPVDGNTRLVVFALGAPYYLDSTEVSKLSAYFALYGAHRPFIDVAARALFADSTPVGHSPVTVAAVDYRIENVTFPDANQNISLSYTLERAGTPVPAAPGEPLVPQQGDTLRLFTDVIVDQNGNSVPDGTVVQFIINYANQGIRDTIQVETSAGVAETAIALNQQGRLLISAVSPPALRSDTIELDEGIDIFTPTPGTATPTPTLPPTPQASNNPVAVATPTPTARPAREEDGSVDFADLYLSVFGLVVMASGVFGYSYRSRDLNYALLLALPIGLGGLLAYNYYALLLPGALMWRNLLGDTWAPPLASWVGGTAGLAMIIAAMNGWLPLRRSR